MRGIAGFLLCVTLFVAARSAVAETDLSARLSPDGTRLAVIGVVLDPNEFRQLEQPAYSRVEVLTIRSPALDDSMMPAISRMPLQSLALSETAVTAKGLAHLRERSLSMITLSRQRVDRAMLECIADLPLTNGILLASADIGDEDLADLKGFENVTLLNVSRTRVTPAGLLGLRAFPNLTSLYLYGIAVSPAELEAIKTKWPGIRVYLQ